MMFKFSLWLFYIFLGIKKIESCYYFKSFEVRKIWKLIMLVYIDGKIVFRVFCVCFMVLYWFVIIVRM